MRPRCRPSATSASPTCRRCCTPTAAPATPGRCCWCCRAWTPRVRAASSNTLSEQVIRRASGTRASASRPSEELAHHYLWRIRNALPTAGHIGVFDRCHYEDVLIVRVHNLVPPDVWEPRYDEINAFEKELVDGGTTLIKVAMFVSLDEQKTAPGRAARRPDKYWKYNPGRHRRTAEVAAVPGGLPGAAGQDVDRLRAVARDAVRPQVVQPAGRHRAADRGARGARLVLAPSRFRCRGRRRSGWPTPSCFSARRRKGACRDGANRATLRLLALGTARARRGSVRVEALARFLAQLAGLDHAQQQRRRSVDAAP